MYMYTVEADMGSVALETNGVRFFFDNGYGDGRHKCIVCNKDESMKNFSEEYTYVGCFEVGRDSNLHLLDYDCGGKRTHKFSEGRWFVYNNRGDVFITYLDDRTDLIK